MKQLTWTGERVVPELMELGSSEREIRHKREVYEKHLERYNFAEPYTRGKTVLDAACGTGYGLAVYDKATNRLGVDVSEDAIQYCKDQYKNIDFSVMNLEHEFYIEDYDVVTSFETIEHLDSPHNFLLSVKRAAKEKFIFSIPINSPSRYHKVVYSRDDIETLINQYFENVEYYEQGDVVNGKFKTKFLLGIADIWKY